ncbi:MAG TPA: pseudouridine synthase [Xanthomonadales bacterium]|nr:pseudouridine synthase [Xanthomonadales bacterium]
MPLEILHADDAIVAVNKPSGLAAHRSKLIGSDDGYLVDAVREATGRTLYLAHRLDRATSGVVLLAASKPLVAALGEQFMARSVGKRYLAVVRGWLDDEGSIDHPLDAPGKPEPKPALTCFRTLARVELPIPLSRYASVRYSLLEVVPETGRYQQIRRHFRHASHHVVGDTTHGRGEHNRLFRARFGVHRMLLHAESLAFAHPATGVRTVVRAPLDAAFQRAIALFADVGPAATGGSAS